MIKESNEEGRDVIELSGKGVIVTGAARGIGRAMTLALLQAGASALAVDIDKDVLDELPGDAGPELASRLHTYEADLAQPDAAAKIIKRCEEVFGGLDALVNNAGLALQTPPKFWQLDERLFEQFFAVHMMAPFALSKAAIPLLQKRERGRIVIVTTSLSTMLRSGFAAYGATKAGLEALAAVMAADLEDTNITTNVLIPGGPTNTRFADGMDEDVRRKLLQPEVMGPPIVWLVSDRSDGVSGRRFLAAEWDQQKSDDEAAEAASHPVAWTALGR